jgi:hypothetical protein
MAVSNVRSASRLPRPRAALSDAPPERLNFARDAAGPQDNFENDCTLSPNGRCAARRPAPNRYLIQQIRGKHEYQMFT